MMLALAHVEQARFVMEYGVPSIGLSYIFKDLVDPPITAAANKIRNVYGFTKNAIKLRLSKMRGCEQKLTEPLPTDAQNKDAV